MRRGDEPNAPLSQVSSNSAFRCRRRQLAPPDLEKFVLWNDRNLYAKDVGRAYLTDRAQVRLFNSSSSLEELYASLKMLHLADEQRLRPNWDQYFMQLASLAALRSNCMKRRVGCVLVRDHRVISTGYNGTPRHLKNCNEGGCKNSFPNAVCSCSVSKLTIQQVHDATAAKVVVLVCQHASAFTPRKTPS